MTLTAPIGVTLGDSTGPLDTSGNDIYSMLVYEIPTTDLPRQLAIQYMLSTAKGMHSFIAPLTFAPCTTLTLND